MKVIGAPLVVWEGPDMQDGGGIDVMGVEKVTNWEDMRNKDRHIRSSLYNPPPSHPCPLSPWTQHPPHPSRDPRPKPRKKRARSDDPQAEVRDGKKVKFNDAESSRQAREKKQKKKRGRRRKMSVTSAERRSTSPTKGDRVEEDASPVSPTTEADKDSRLVLVSSATLSSPPIAAAAEDNKQASTAPVVAKDNTAVLSPRASPQILVQTPTSPAQAKETLGMAELSKKAKAHETLFASLLPSLTCQICLDLLYKPFALAPCGHTACYDCLVRWFTGPPAPGQAAGVPSPHRRKTCPHCRTPIYERPVEVWNIKDLVSAVTKSGLATSFPPPPAAEPAANDQDPWDNIFPKPFPEALRRMFGGPPADDDEGGEDMGMYDPADGVFRCTVCMHEIWGSECSECGRHYPGHVNSILDESDDDNDGPMVGGLPPLWRPWPVPGLAGLLNGGEEADELDGDRFESASDGSYEGSFIDDEGGEVIELSSDDVVAPNPQRRARRRDGRRSAPLIISDNEDEDENEREAQRNRRRNAAPAARHSQRRVADSDEEDDELVSDGSASGTRTSVSHDGGFSSVDEDDDGSIARPPIHLAHLLGGRPRYEEEGIFRAYSDSDDDADTIEE
ncbi:hypothetical protein EVG20_g4271 [Dentipellis fragilis]|uniref:RING-type domain-containing protein n=1 Tax=Dentipellis fragilis TaxID=205917 RepID=A0A4Y9YWX1_9AGAM|nr:hypothetical protein EVG20_g4271 [Dentipellis fragilis]